MKRRNRQRRESRQELLKAMAPVPLTGDALTLDSVPSDIRRAVHFVAVVLERYGCEPERATDAAFAHVCWSARVAGVWPAVVDEAHGVHV